MSQDLLPVAPAWADETAGLVDDRIDAQEC
jgi:hypothetical protein